MKRIISCVLFIFVFISSCGYTKLSDQVTSFTLTAPTQLDNVSGAYTVINNIQTLSEEAVLVNQYAKKGYQPEKLKAFMSDDDLSIRIQVLNSLKQYTSILTALTDGRNDKRVNGLSVDVRITSSSSAPKPGQRNVLTDQDLGILLVGLNAIVNNAIHSRVKNRLPMLMTRSDPYIQDFVLLFRTDLLVLRQQAANSYQEQLLLQSQFITDNQTRLSAEENKAEILKLVDIQMAAETTDKNFDAAIHSADDFGNMHREIARTEVSGIAPISQKEVQQNLQAGLTGLKEIYWKAPIEQRKSIAATEIKMTQLITKLNKADIQSRDADYLSASNDFNTDILPAVVKLQRDIDKDIDRYITVKDALESLEKVEEVTSYFTIQANLPKP